MNAFENEIYFNTSCKENMKIFVKYKIAPLIPIFVFANKP